MCRTATAVAQSEWRRTSIGMENLASSFCLIDWRMPCFLPSACPPPSPLPHAVLVGWRRAGHDPGRLSKSFTLFLGRVLHEKSGRLQARVHMVRTVQAARHADLHSKKGRCRGIQA